MDAKRRGELAGFGAERDDRVPRCRADGLADSVAQHQSRDGVHRPARKQQPSQPADRGNGVAEAGRQLAASRAIGDESAHPRGDQRPTFVQPGRESEGERGEPAGHDQIGRQNADHHLRRDVRQQARDAEPPDVCGDAPAQRIPRVARECREPDEPVAAIQAERTSESHWLTQVHMRGQQSYK